MVYLRQQEVERLRTEPLSITPHTMAEKGQAERIAGYDGNVQASFRLAAEAAKIAVAQAEAVARATGRQLEAMRRIEVDPGRWLVTPGPMMRVAAMPAAAPVPIATEAGEAEVTASVSVTMELVELRAP